MYNNTVVQEDDIGIEREGEGEGGGGSKGKFLWFKNGHVWNSLVRFMGDTTPPESFLRHHVCYKGCPMESLLHLRYLP